MPQNDGLVQRIIERLRIKQKDKIYQGPFSKSPIDYEDKIKNMKQARFKVNATCDGRTLTPKSPIEDSGQEIWSHVVRTAKSYRQDCKFLEDVPLRVNHYRENGDEIIKLSYQTKVQNKKPFGPTTNKRKLEMVVEDLS